MRVPAGALIACVLAITGCGASDDEDPASSAKRPAAPAPGKSPAGKKPAGKHTARQGARIVLGGSEYGSMLFGENEQAIYIFENDSRGKSNCYADCAEAWPPVYANGKPRAGEGVRAQLLGTTRRRDGRAQVTYAGRPLYYYAHEGPGEVRCHNVDLNGGLWWVVGADGRRRP